MTTAPEFEPTRLVALVPRPGPGRRLSDLPDVASVAEVAIFLGVSRNLVWRAIADGQLEAIRLGRRVLIPRTSVISLLGEDRGE